VFREDAVESSVRPRIYLSMGSSIHLVRGLIVVALACGCSPAQPVAIAVTRPIAQTLPELPLLDRSKSCQASVVRLRPLDSLEQRNTLRDLLGVARLPTELTTSSLDSDATPRLSHLSVERQLDSAIAVGALALPRIRQLAGCDPVESLECAPRFVSEFGLRVFRRPLGDDEQTRYLAFFRKEAAGRGLRGATAVTVAAFLQSPQFLYHWEANDVGPASDFALASRLSYAIWRSMPDEELLASAGRARLQRRGGYEAELVRMFKDPKATDAFANFVVRWFELDRVLREPKNRSLFPDWNVNVARNALKESKHLAASLYESGRATLTGLLLSRDALVDDSLASTYGVPLQGGWHEVELPEPQRAGLLTRVAFLASNAHNVPSPPLRGNSVLRNVLCAPPASPPPAVQRLVPTDGDGLSPTTNRQRFETVIAQQASCRACHTTMDQLGYAFESYGATGKFRTHEANGTPIDTRVSLRQPGMLPTMDGALELSRALSESEQAQYCAVFRLYGFVNGSEPDGSAWCVTDRAFEAMRRSGGDLTAAWMTLVRSTAGIDSPPG